MKHTPHETPKVVTNPVRVLVSAKFTKHNPAAGDYGLWIRVHRAAAFLRPGLVTKDRQRKVIGIYPGHLVVCLQAGGDTPLRTLSVAEAIPCATWAAEKPGDAAPKIDWLGDGAARREQTYAVRVYIPKPLLVHLPPVKLEAEMPAALWMLPPDWTILDVPMPPAVG